MSKPPRNRMDWDKVRVFLAVARAGQILGAARLLGVNHATVARQLDALEYSLKTRLFDRHIGGCALTPAGETMLAAAERAESEFMRLEADLSGAAGAISGTVRIGAPDGFGNQFLAPGLARLAMVHPELLVQLLPLPRIFSLSKREADLVITLDRPRQGNLTVQKLTDYSLGLYVSKSYLRRRPIIRQDDLNKHLFITYVDDFLYSSSLGYAHDLAGQAGNRFECGSVIGQLEAVRAGAGVAILHDYIARRFSDLTHVLPKIRFVRTYWLVSHPDTHHAYRVTEVRRHILEMVRAARMDFMPRP